MKSGVHLGVLLALACLVPPPSTTAAFSAQKQRDTEKVRREEQEDHYKRWLERDVSYIITDSEKDVFKRLTTGAEKEQFIEQFWRRRDPDLTTVANEFKDEHYRRIAYANENFPSGIPGWLTDRGRVYIIHGPPDEIETHASGGIYDRPIYEGGGSSTAFPFEIWRYRYIEGIGSDVELEFVDRSMTGEYRLALMAEEKDALLHVAGAGPTIAEQMGLATRADRPYFSPGNSQRYPFINPRAKDSPFQRYETYDRIQRPPQLRYPDLKELVKVQFAYHSLPIQVQKDYFRLSDRRLLVPVTVQVANKNLTFRKKRDIFEADVVVYGRVTTMTNRVVHEFEQDLSLSYRRELLKQALARRSQYQEILLLEPKMRYKIDVVVKDLNSGNVGTVRQGIIPPSYPEEKLASSSLILSDHIRPLKETPKDNVMFVLGDVSVRPSIDKVFPLPPSFGVYIQVYNAALDQTNSAPALSISYKIVQNGKTLEEVIDESGDTIQFYSNRRVVIIRQLPVAGLGLGKYKVLVKIHDRIRGQTVMAEESFEIKRNANLDSG